MLASWLTQGPNKIPPSHPTRVKTLMVAFQDSFQIDRCDVAQRALVNCVPEATAEDLANAAADCEESYAEYFDTLTEIEVPTNPEVRAGYEACLVEGSLDASSGVCTAARLSLSDAAANETLELPSLVEHCFIRGFLKGLPASYSDPSFVSTCAEQGQYDQPVCQQDNPLRGGYEACADSINACRDADENYGLNDDNCFVASVIATESLPAFEACSAVSCDEKPACYEALILGDDN